MTSRKESTPQEAPRDTINVADKPEAVAVGRDIRKGEKVRIFRQKPSRTNAPATDGQLSVWAPEDPDPLSYITRSLNAYSDGRNSWGPHVPLVRAIIIPIEVAEALKREVEQARAFAEALKAVQTPS